MVVAVALVPSAPPQKYTITDADAGVKKKQTIPLCDVAHELTSRTYGEKKWWVVIVKDQ